jgi:hypothetical protein
MTPSLTQARPAKSTRFDKKAIVSAALIFCAALLVFASGLRARFFDDEYADITQSYYADLFFGRQFDDKLWLEPEAVDRQPLPKYLIGLAFRVASLPMPGPADARSWYFPSLRKSGSRVWGGPETLLTARLAVIPLGALGCLALFASGALVEDARLGMIAACLLMINPLYGLHAHRAMADVPYEAFMLSSLAVWLFMWVRICSKGSIAAAVVLPWFAGTLGGMSLSCKFNGFLGLGIVVACSGLTWLPGRLSIARRLAVTGATIVTVAVAMAMALALNPYMTAKPAERGLSLAAASLRAKNVWERFCYQVTFRLDTAKHEKVTFPNDALHNVGEKTKVVLVQGFGRFGLFGPRAADTSRPWDRDRPKRYDVRQDWGCVLWLSIVCFGLYESVQLGRLQLARGAPPAALVAVVWAASAWLIVTLYLPMAWDRYQLPIQSGNALLAAVGVCALWDRLAAARGTRQELARAF